MIVRNRLVISAKPINLFLIIGIITQHALIALRLSVRLEYVRLIFIVERVPLAGWSG